MEENNKLIAEFMGDTHKSVLNIGKVYKDYSKSWDWLMPVVSRITKGECNYEHDENQENNREYIMDIIPYGNIDDTYNAVVEFIKEYNNGKN